MAHDYGIGRIPVREYSIRGTAFWEKRPYKKVSMINPKDCKDRITVEHLRERLMGTGWFEWETLLSTWLVEDIVEAINNDSEEADISRIFSIELQGEDEFGTFAKPQDRVIDFLMGRLFECVEETDDVLRVRIIEKAIS